jgi:hypothetical protein
MQQITLKELDKGLTEPYFCENLKYQSYCLVKSGKPQAWLVPSTQNSDISLCGNIATKQMKGQVYYWVRQLWDRKAKYPNTIVGFAVVSPGSEHICNLMVDDPALDLNKS